MIELTCTIPHVRPPQLSSDPTRTPSAKPCYSQHNRVSDLASNRCPGCKIHQDVALQVNSQSFLRERSVYTDQRLANFVVKPKRRWFWAHSAIQLVVSAPVIFLGWALGYNTTTELEEDHFMDPHQKVGLALLVLYVVQILLGVLVHYVKLPSLFRGYRPPHSYLHILLGLAILALAQWQVWSSIFSS